MKGVKMSVNVNLLSELIRMKPVSKDIAAVNRAEDRMKEYLESNGLFCTMEIINGRHTLFASTEQGRTPDFLLNAHMDVVPGEDEQFVPRIEGKRMYARGTADCLGSCVAIADVLIELKDKASCGAIFTADEEIGGSTSGGMVKLGYGAKKCILVVDAMFDKLVYFQKGIIAIEVIMHSKTGGGHASYPWAFDNPIDRLVDGYVRLRSSWIQPTAEAQWSNSMTPCIISGGCVHNQIPGTASMMLNIRYMKADDREKILKLIKEETKCDELREFEGCVPVETDPNVPVIQRLIKVMSRHFGKDIPCVRMNGATDARYFAELNVPLAMVGVNGVGEHSPCEYAELDSYDTVSAYLREFILG